MNHQQIREEMVYYGAENVSLSQLLAVVIGTKNRNLLSKLENLGIRQLSTLSIPELLEIKGVSEAMALKIQAIFALSKKLYTSKKEETEVIRSVDDAINILSYLKFEKQEHFVCLYLNNKNEVLSRKTLFIGTLNATTVHPREIFKEGLKLSAASIILGHNHPSGHPTPSPEDLSVTKRLVDCGYTIGIEVLDHIIVGDGKSISLKEKGYL